MKCAKTPVSLKPYPSTGGDPLESEVSGAHLMPVAGPLLPRFLCKHVLWARAGGRPHSRGELTNRLDRLAGNRAAGIPACRSGPAINTGAGREPRCCATSMTNITHGAVSTHGPEEGEPPWTEQVLDNSPGETP